jgi:hypothetical protein
LLKRYNPYRFWTVTVEVIRGINSMRTKTHFEQIPVETVKRIATELPETRVVQERDEITPPQEHWRETARQVVEEPDPQKMTELVKQPLAELDARAPHKGSSSVGQNVLNRVKQLSMNLSLKGILVCGRVCWQDLFAVCAGCARAGRTSILPLSREDPAHRKFSALYPLAA